MQRGNGKAVCPGQGTESVRQREEGNLFPLKPMPRSAWIRIYTHSDAVAFPWLLDMVLGSFFSCWLVLTEPYEYHKNLSRLKQAAIMEPYMYDA